MASASRPQILLLSLEHRDFLDETYSAFFNSLMQSAHIKRAKTASAALRTLEETTFKAIIVTDEGLTKPDNKPVLRKVESYIHNGGLAIVGLHFPCFTRMDVFNKFFEALGLPWENGDYHRSDFEVNPSCVLPDTSSALSSFPAPYSMKVLHVKHARPSERILVPARGAQTQSLAFCPGGVDHSQAAVAGARLGLGFLVYCGDVNSGDDSSRVMLALCGF